MAHAFNRSCVVNVIFFQFILLYDAKRVGWHVLIFFWLHFITFSMLYNSLCWTMIKNKATNWNKNLRKITSVYWNLFYHWYNYVKFSIMLVFIGCFYPHVDSRVKFVFISNIHLSILSNIHVEWECPSINNIFWTPRKLHVHLLCSIDLILNMQPFTRPESVVMNGLICAIFKAIDMQILYFESRLRYLTILIFRVLYNCRFCQYIKKSQILKKCRIANKNSQM